METRVFVLVLALAGAGLAAPLSVIDPPVTVNAIDTRLSVVLATISAQTGLTLSGMAPVANLDWMPEEQRERVDPKISLKAEARPLRGVLSLLREQGLQVQTQGNTVIVAPRRGPQQKELEQPTVTAGPYRLTLVAISTEDVSNFTLGGIGTSRQGLTAVLALATDSELARRTLLGAATTGSASLDGQSLEPKPRTIAGAEYLPIGRGANDRDSFSLEFGLPKSLPQHLDHLTGSLAVLPAAEEVIFEFGDLAQDNQQQSENDIDVTLVHCAEYDGTPKTWTAELAVSMPLTEPLLKMISAAQTGGMGRGGFGGPGGMGGPGMQGPPPGMMPGDGMGMPGMMPPPPPPGMILDGMGMPGAPPGPPNLGQAPDAAEPHVLILAQGPPPNAGGMGMPGMMPGMGGMMPGMMGGMGMVGGNASTHPLMPVVVLETAAGRRRMELSQVNLQQSRDGDKRISAHLVFSCPATTELPRMLVGIIDPGAKVGGVPFAFRDVDLPKAAK